MDTIGPMAAGSEAESRQQLKQLAAFFSATRLYLSFILQIAKPAVLTASGQGSWAGVAVGIGRESVDSF
jgi:hypothetical protein